MGFVIHLHCFSFGISRICVVNVSTKHHEIKFRTPAISPAITSNFLARPMELQQLSWQLQMIQMEAERERPIDLVNKISSSMKQIYSRGKPNNQAPILKACLCHPFLYFRDASKNEVGTTLYPYYTWGIYSMYVCMCVYMCVYVYMHACLFVGREWKQESVVKNNIKFLILEDRCHLTFGN